MCITTSIFVYVSIVWHHFNCASAKNTTLYLKFHLCFCNVIQLQNANLCFTGSLYLCTEKHRVKQRTILSIYEIFLYNVLIWKSFLLNKGKSQTNEGKKTNKLKIWLRKSNLIFLQHVNLGREKQFHFEEAFVNLVAFHFETNYQILTFSTGSN